MTFVVLVYGLFHIHVFVVVVVVVFISLIIADGSHSILPVVTKDLPISPRFTPYESLSRCEFSTLTTRQPMIEFYLLTFSRFPLREKRTQILVTRIELTTSALSTSRCAGCLPYHL